ncbi:MAG: NAD(P)H-dependent oxidoreductase [Actinomycetes bacterium]
MSSLLHIEVSPSGENSVSRSITADFLSTWSAAHAGGTVITRDLNLNPIPHLDAEAIFASYTPEGDRSAAMAAKNAFRLELAAEITGVDEILISTPMWNWSVPSVLKAYFDQVIMPGTLDASRATGLAGKKVTFVVAQGGSYAEGAPRHGWDYSTGYLKLVASALGSTDVEIILAEFTLAGVVPGMDAFVDTKAASINAAKSRARERAAA